MTTVSTTDNRPTALTDCPSWCRNIERDEHGTLVHGDDHFAFVAESYAGAEGGHFSVYLRQWGPGDLGIKLGVDLPINAELLPSQARSLAAGLLRAADVAEGLL